MQELSFLQDQVVRSRRQGINKLEIDLRNLSDRIDSEEKAVELAKTNYLDAREQYRSGLITLTCLGRIQISSTFFDLRRAIGDC